MTTTSDPASVEMPGAQESSTEIVERVSGVTEHAVSIMPLLTDDEIRRLWRTATALAASKMFKDVTQGEQAFAKMVMGRDLGLSPTQAMTDLHIIEGKPVTGANLLAGFVRRRETYDFRVAWLKIDGPKEAGAEHPPITAVWADEEALDDLRDTYGCAIMFTVDAKQRGVSRWTLADSIRAGLTANRGTKTSLHVRFPRAMFYARALSQGVRHYVPECTAGIPVYVEGEITPRESYAQVPDHGKPKADPDLPAVLAGLVAQAHAIDPNAWRVAEVAARLPDPGDDGYAAAVEAIRNEVASWLAEHDPPEAEVVDAKATDAEDPQARWDSDPEWRAQVEPLVNAYADISAGLDEALSENDEPTAGRMAAELAGVADTLDALGYPAGWVPSAETQA